LNVEERPFAELRIDTGEELSGALEPQTQAEAAPEPVKEPPALSELLDQNLLLGFQRFTEIVSKLGEKSP